MRDKRVLLVTGASSDVGYGLIKSVSAQYRAVLAHYCSSMERIKTLKDELGDKIIPLQADFTEEKSTEEMIRQIRDGGICPDHIVHLSAPKTFNKQFPKCKWEDYQKGIDTSLRSIVMILREFMPLMAKNHYGKVVFMLSAYVIGVPPKFQSPYITVKYALLGLMRNITSEYAGKGIAVNAVSPDMMETKFLTDIPELIIEQNAKRHPLGRNIKVSEVIPTFEYLLSDAADIVTGQNIGVTGGVEIT